MRWLRQGEGKLRAQDRALRNLTFKQQIKRGGTGKGSREGEVGELEIQEKAVS